MISKEDTDKYLAQILEILKEQFEAGGKWALLDAIYHCCLLKRPLPEWLQHAFLAAHDAKTGYEIRSWDDVFGQPAPKYAHLETERQKMDLRPLIIERVAALGAKQPIDKALFELIGEELGISGTTVSDIYYDERSRELREMIHSLDTSENL